MSLSINSVTPYSYQSQIPLNTYLAIAFNTEIQDSYLNDLTVGDVFQLYEATTYVKIGVVGAKTATDALTVNIIPSKALTANTQYLLIVIGQTNGVKNLASEELADNYNLNFTTGSITDNTLVINVVDTTVTFGLTPAPATPPLDQVTSIVDFNKVINAVANESGLAGLTFDETGSLVSDLYLDYSSPEDEDVGIRDLSVISTYWNHPIMDRYIGEIKVYKTPLPIDFDIFSNKEVTVNARGIVNDQLYLDIAESGMDNTLNSEYTVSIPQGAITAVDEPTAKNGKTIIRFMGPLSPLFATPELVKSLMSLSFDPSELSDMSDYQIYKKIQMVSWELINSYHIVIDPTSPRMYWVAKYVACRTAYDLIRGPYGFYRYVTQRVVVGQSVSFGQIDRKFNPLDDCMVDALQHLGFDVTRHAGKTGVKSGENPFYAGRTRTVKDSTLDVILQSNLFDKYLRTQ